MRVTITTPPFSSHSCYLKESPWIDSPQWPARWVLPPVEWKAPWVAAFRCRFSVTKRTRDRLHVSADERYELFLDGERLGCGPQRGDRSQWFYESYALDLTPGEHVLVACVWRLGPLQPWAQMSIQPGFFCCPEKPELIESIATGTGKWECRRMEERTFCDMSEAAGTGVGAGPSERVDLSKGVPDWERGAGEGWQKPQSGPGAFHGQEPHATRPFHWLRPASLPEPLWKPWTRGKLFRAEPTSVITADNWRAWYQGKKSLQIPAHTRCAVLIDLEDYVCAYPELRWSGGAGARLSLGWAEALLDPDTKEKRHGEVPLDGVFRGPVDELLPDGGNDRWWRPLWWRCGNYVQLQIETAEESLTLQSLTFWETRYPLRVEAKWKTLDTEWNRVLAISRRTLEMCLHETYVDCPYYEQLMYVGDTRLQALMTYAVTSEDHLPRTALELLDSSRLNPSGLVAACHPNNGGQLIPPFALWWVAMVYDFALWRGDRAFLRERLPGVRAVLEQFRRHVDEDGIVRGLNGWNYYDWTFQPGGVAPGGEPGGRNAGLQALWMLALGHAIALEQYAGEPELVSRYRRWQREARGALVKHFWEESRGLFAEAIPHVTYSEQTQCLALLAGTVNAWQKGKIWRALSRDKDLMRTSGFFSHYYFSACVQAGRMDLFENRFDSWRQMARDGFRTTPETFGQTRSDCHAWSAHPLYHFLTGVLGVQPALIGFEAVAITPQLGTLKEASGTLAHPLGPIRVQVWQSGVKVRGEVELPKGLRGVWNANGKSRSLRAGTQKV